MVTCEICGKEFKNTQGLRGHKNFVHSNRSSITAVTRAASGQQVSKLEARLEKLEYMTGLTETSTLDDVLRDDKPLSEKIIQVTEQLNHLIQQLADLSSNTASNRDIHNIEEKVSQLTQQLSDCSKWVEPVRTVKDTMSRLEVELSNKAHNTRVNAMENRLRCLEEESKEVGPMIAKCFDKYTACLGTNLPKIVEGIRPMVDALVTPIKQLQEQVREQKQVTDWVKKEYNLRPVQKAR